MKTFHMLSFDIKTPFHLPAFTLRRPIYLAKIQATEITILIMTLFKYDVVLEAFWIRKRGAPWVITCRR